MDQNGAQLPLDRCPQCNTAKPRLDRLWAHSSKDHAGGNPRFWGAYLCASCGGIILAVSPHGSNNPVSQIWPAQQEISTDVPERARYYLSHALASLHAPPGAVMLAASAVDAMLRDKGYKDGTLNARIDAAAKAHLITDEMAAWAHEIRLDANDQRHADDGAPLPTIADAAKAIEFAKALAQFLYVLPARVARGRKPDKAP